MIGLLEFDYNFFFYVCYFVYKLFYKLRSHVHSSPKTIFGKFYLNFVFSSDGVEKKS